MLFPEPSGRYTVQVLGWEHTIQDKQPSQRLPALTASFFDSFLLQFLLGWKHCTEMLQAIAGKKSSLTDLYSCHWLCDSYSLLLIQGYDIIMKVGKKDESSVRGQ